MSVLRKKYASESKKKYTLIKCRTLAGILNWIRLAFLGAAAETVAQPFHNPLLPFCGRS